MNIDKHLKQQICFKEKLELLMGSENRVGWEHTFDSHLRLSCKNHEVGDWKTLSWKLEILNRTQIFRAIKKINQ